MPTFSLLGLPGNCGHPYGLWDSPENSPSRRIRVSDGLVQRCATHIQQFQSLHTQQEVQGIYTNTYLQHNIKNKAVLMTDFTL